MSTPSTLTFAHLSDLHLRHGLPRRASLARRALDLPEVLEADHVVVTGDITESGLASELELADAVLHVPSRNGRLLVVPGNHDVSLRGLNVVSFWNRWTGARQEASSLLADLSLRGSDACATGIRGSPWPIRKTLGGGRCVLYGLDSTHAVGSNLLASGRLGSHQVEALDDDMASLPADQCVVIALHHHVTSHPAGKDMFDIDQTMALDDKRELQRLLRRYKVELVLHGHRHRFWHQQFRDTQVIGAASTTLGCTITGERFVVLVSLDLNTGCVTARRRFMGRDDDSRPLEEVDLDHSPR